MSRDRAFRVVADFEAALCEFTGAPYCVTVDSCTNAIFLALKWRVEQRGESKSALFESMWREVELPRHTYVGVVQAVRNAGFRVAWRDESWRGAYELRPHEIIDSAKRFERGMWFGAYGGAPSNVIQCVSFQAGKLLPIGRGGAILTDNAEAAEWFRRARLDGRTSGADYHDNEYQQFGAHCYLDPPSAARGLWLMTYLEDEDDGSWREYPDLSEATWV